MNTDLIPQRRGFHPELDLNSGLCKRFGNGNSFLLARSLNGLSEALRNIQRDDVLRRKLNRALENPKICVCLENMIKTWINLQDEDQITDYYANQPDLLLTELDRAEAEDLEALQLDPIQEMNNQDPIQNDEAEVRYREQPNDSKSEENQDRIEDIARQQLPEVDAGDIYLNNGINFVLAIVILFYFLLSFLEQK